MSRTINGRTIKEIFDLLKEDLPEEEIQVRDYDSVVYISADAYRERLNSVVGSEHYNEMYSEVELVQAKDSIVAKTTCTIELLDDDFEPFLKKQSAGGSNIMFPYMDKKDDAGNVIKDASGKPRKVPMSTSATIPNDFDGACQDAFKRTLKKGFLIGKQQLDKAKEGVPYILTIMRTANSTNGGHKFLSGKANDGKIFNIAVFKNKVSDFEKAFPEIKVNSVITIFGKEKIDKQGNPQIIFEKAGKMEVKKPEVAKLVTLEVVFEQEIQERKRKKGDYSTVVSGKKDNLKYNLVFQKEDILKIGLAEWEKLLQSTILKEEKPVVSLKVEKGMEGKTEVYYVKGLCG